MDNLTVNWEDIEIYRYKDFYKTGKGRMPYSVELKNTEVISIECWINRIQQHIEENNNKDLYEALKEYWTKNNNGNTPEFAAYHSYTTKVFNMPTWAGFKEFKTKGLYIESLGDIYPWSTLDK